MNLLSRGSRWALLVPLLLLGSNLVAFAIFQTKYSDRVTSLREAVAQERESLAGVAAQRRQLERLVSAAATARSGIGDLYREKFASESERFTAFLHEVKSLADRAGLEHPQGYSYPEDRPEKDGVLIKRSVVFSVTGTYEQLREYINFLELSDEFIVLERVDLSNDPSNAGSRLTIGLTLSTLFAGRDEGPST